LSIERQVLWRLSVYCRQNLFVLACSLLYAVIGLSTTFCEAKRLVMFGLRIKRQVLWRLSVYCRQNLFVLACSLLYAVIGLSTIFR